MSRMKLASLLLCALCLVTVGCGKRSKTAKPTETSTAPSTADGKVSDFETSSGGLETPDVKGADLPLGDEPPNLDKYRDPSAGPGGEDPGDVGGEGGGDLVPLPKGAAEAFRDVRFDFDSYKLSAEARQILTGVGAYMAVNGSVSCVIEGHCDERGTAAYNLALGEKRALAVREFLAGMKIAPSRMTTVSFGEERPADPGHGEQAWAQNRRAHFRVSGK